MLSELVVMPKSNKQNVIVLQCETPIFWFVHFISTPTTAYFRYNVTTICSDWAIKLNDQVWFNHCQILIFNHKVILLHKKQRLGCHIGLGFSLKIIKNFTLSVNKLRCIFYFTFSIVTTSIRPSNNISYRIIFVIYKMKIKITKVIG